MSVQVETLGMAKLTVEISADRLEKHLTLHTTSRRKSISLPGFP